MTPLASLDRITVDPRILGGMPSIRGMRLSVERVLAVLAENPNWDELRRDYPELEDEDVRQVLAFAAALVAGRVRLPKASAA